VPRCGSFSKSCRSVVFDISLECCLNALHAGSSRRDCSRREVDEVVMMEGLLALEMRWKGGSLDGLNDSAIAMRKV
jgi:hypothetical protein